MCRYAVGKYALCCASRVTEMPPAPLIDSAMDLACATSRAFALIKHPQIPMLRSNRLCFVVFLAFSSLCGVDVAHAQARASNRLPLSFGDSVRAWSKVATHEPVIGLVVRQRGDTIVLAPERPLMLGTLTRLDVRAPGSSRARVGSGGRALRGLAIGAVVGGAIGFCATGGCSGSREKGPGTGFGLLVGLPLGGLLGAAVGGLAMPSQRSSSTEWVTVELPH